MDEELRQEIAQPWRKMTNQRLARRMEELWREATRKLTVGEWSKSRLQWEDWETLGPEAVELAKQELRRRRWRGARGGVAPRGYDAEAIAYEVIGEMLQGKSRVGAGWTRERLVKELERMISGKVRALNSLKETKAMRNECDISPRKASGEPVSVLPQVLGEEQSGYEALVEAEEGRESLRRRIEAQLEAEPELKAVFGRLWEGDEQSAEIAQRLGMEAKAVVLARRRLARRLKRLRGTGLEEQDWNRRKRS